jgi:hypothetical protein
MRIEIMISMFKFNFKIMYKLNQSIKRIIFGIFLMFYAVYCNALIYEGFIGERVVTLCFDSDDHHGIYFYDDEKNIKYFKSKDGKFIATENKFSENIFDIWTVEFDDKANSKN